MYDYQQNNRYFAQAADDIADLVSNELTDLGASDISPAYRGVYFNAHREVLYKINYHSRLINRVLAPLIHFDCHSDKYLYKTASQIEWSDFMTADQTFAVFASVTQSHINHSKFAALRLKDAIVDYFRTKDGRRPSIDRRQPHVWFNLYIENNHAVISVDTSGGSLHRRGYRVQTTQAPMAETVAASIIKLSDWQGATPLYDPFCGSGTILCEAWLAASHTPSAYRREHFGFEALPDFEPALWKKVKKQALNKIITVPGGSIGGSDLDAEVLETARVNCNALGPQQNIQLKRQDVFKISGLNDMTIVCNPPYGLRLSKGQDMAAFYKNFGDFLKQRCTGSSAYIYFGDRRWLKHIGLRSTWKKPLQNGGLDGRLAKFELY